MINFSSVDRTLKQKIGKAAALFSFTLDKIKANFQAVTFVFFIYVLDKGFQVQRFFISHR